MKKQVIFLLTVLSVLWVLAGCGKEEIPTVTTGDFRMEIPNGYTITDICDTKCTIMKGETEVGGIILTQLTEKNRNDKLPLYLDSVTGTNVINEYFSWDAVAENGSAMQLVNHSVTDQQTKAKEEFHRILFVKDGGVYDMWFDTSLISYDEIQEAFYPLF